MMVVSSRKLARRDLVRRMREVAGSKVAEVVSMSSGIFEADRAGRE